MKVKTNELTGSALDWAVAVCEGFGWAKNMGIRCGDSIGHYNDSHYKDQWVMGSRCFVGPDSLKDLHPTKPNWDGWCACDMTEPLAPAAYYALPKYSTRWHEGGPIIEREAISLYPNYIRDGSGNYQGWLASTLRGKKVGLPRPSAHGPTPLEAAMRCYVASKLGDEVEIPNEVI